ncbi:hypothetical protein JCM30197_02160 [Schleiferia thermophila]|nr:hypothetical protein JCM30197_02160 [Schleiferia thermophila]
MRDAEGAHWGGAERSEARERSAPRSSPTLRGKATAAVAGAQGHALKFFFKKSIVEGSVFAVCPLGRLGVNGCFRCGVTQVTPGQGADNGILRKNYTDGNF